MAKQISKLTDEEKARYLSMGRGLLHPTDGKAAMYWNSINTHVLKQIAGSLSGDDEPTRLVLQGEIERVALELAGPNPSPAVVTLAQTAALCWGDLRRAQATFYDPDKQTTDIWTYRDKRVSRCHARYVRSVKVLTEVKRLESRIPAVQINVVNVEAKPEGQAEAELRLRTA